MTMARLVIFLLGSLITTAQAQQQTAYDRLAIGFGQCVGKAEANVDLIESLQRQLAEAKAKLKELEPKKEEPDGK